MIIALDPGVTTGVAFLTDSGMIHTDQIEYTHQLFWGYLNSLGSNTMANAIVYESFIYQRRNKVELYPVEVIGVIKLYGEMYDIPLFVQSASQAKNFMTDDKIKKMGLWVRGQKHGMDALRHLLYHLIVTKGDKSWLEPLRPV